MSDTLTKREIRALNAARTILARHAEGFPDDFGAARVVTLAECAENGIFRFLNNAHTWGHVPMTEDELYNRPSAVPVPQSLRA